MLLYACNVEMRRGNMTNEFQRNSSETAALALFVSRVMFKKGLCDRET